MRFSVDGVDYHLPGRLPTNAEKSAQYLLLRLLLGAAQVGRKGKLTAQSQDYSQFPSVPQTSSSASSVAQFLATNVGLPIQSFVRVTLADNRRLFFDVLAEYSNHFVATARGSHTTGFIHLYRALERLSYSVPLLYCSTSNDFVGTFKDLKSFFEDEAAGELGLLKKFIKQGKLIDPVVLSTTATLDFSVSAQHGQRFYDVANRYGQFQSSDPTRLQLAIEYRLVLELFVALRNRFFHLRSGDGQKNIQSRDVQDADEFFSFVNPVFCSFLGHLTLACIARKYRV